jgi:hypothetical protein
VPIRPQFGRRVLLGANILSELTFGALNNFVADPAALFQRPEAVHLDGGKMGKDIFATALRFDEAKTFCIVEPFHRSDRHAGAPFPLIGGILNLGLRAVKASGGGWHRSWKALKMCLSWRFCGLELPPSGAISETVNRQAPTL